MKLDYYYGVYSKAPIPTVFNPVSWEDRVETLFPADYCPEISFKTRSEMYALFLYTMLGDTGGWTEIVKIKHLRDSDMKKQYIEYYKGHGLSENYILERCSATQVNINALPHTMAYKPTSYTHLYTTDILNSFCFYYYNRRYQKEFHVDNLLPIYLPKEPIHQFWDMIQERMDKLNPPRRKR